MIKRDMGRQNHANEQTELTAGLLSLGDAGLGPAAASQAEHFAHSLSFPRTHLPIPLFTHHTREAIC